jgi:glycosyltransferase involved in cell wall biosynthesis
MKRITFVSFYDPEDSMAAAVRLKRMVTVFHEYGWQTLVLTPVPRLPAVGLAKFVSVGAQVLGITRRALGVSSTTDIYYLSTPPQSLLFPALILRLFTKVPVVLEERDLLTISPIVNFRILRCNPFTRFIEHWLLKNAHQSVVVTQGLKEDILRQWPDLSVKPPEVIWNGFWKKDFEFLKLGAGGDSTGANDNSAAPLKLIHIGNFYGSRNPLPLVLALKLLKERHPDLELARCFKIKFIGCFQSSTDKELFVTKANEAGVSELFELSDLKPRNEALQETASSDVAILITHTSGSENALPAKIFEYMALGKPILAITHDPLVVDAVKSHDLGWQIPHQDVSALADRLHWMATHQNEVRNKKTGGMGLSRFDARFQLEKLDKTLSRLAEKPL